MALTGPIHAPITFNAVYELDDLVRYLTKVQADLDSRFEYVYEVTSNIELNDCGHIRYDNIRKMLENAVGLCEGLAVGMSKFTHSLIDKKLIKRNTSLPQMYMLDHHGIQKRDSGIAFESASSSSEISPEASSNRLSAYGDEQSDEKTQRQVSFELMTPSTSSNELDEQAKVYDKSIPTMHQRASKVFVHLIPAEPDTDLSALRAELSNFSASVFRSHNIDVQLVSSSTCVELSPRHVSTSSEEHSSAKSHFRLSNEYVGAQARNNLSRLALEHSETSEEDNTRLLSSSDSDASILRHRWRPIIERKSVETQTEWDLVETQTE